jgi:hypothetical protein
MRKNWVALALLVILIILPTIPAQALSQNEIQLTFYWSTNYYYQGDTGSVTITLKSTCGDELEFSWIGIHFPWLQSGYYYSLDLSSNPMRIPSQGQITFDPIIFNIPSAASLGWNVFEILIQYKEHHWYGWSGVSSWTSTSSSSTQLYIRDAYEKTYSTLVNSVYNDLNYAKNKGYESPSVKSLIDQATNEYNLALSLASQGKYSDAVNHLQTASNLISQAPAKEDEFQLSSWRDKAQGSITIANQKIDLIKKCEGTCLALGPFSGQCLS